MSGVFVYTNLVRFLGLSSVGAMIMYSGINPDRDDHLLMPRVSVTDSFGFASIVLFEPRGIQTSEASEFGTVAEWLDDQDRPYRVNLNYLRYHMNRICGSAPGGTVRLTLRKEGEDTLDFENVCAEPAMLWYLALPAASECDPSCGSTLRRWARGRLGSD